ncbi:MAG: hypothetical protein P4L33_08070 [Capsulimonadaceae bacterium]|nr:hypothetical protein [Capsulimonadaceae bacterium]
MFDVIGRSIRLFAAAVVMSLAMGGCSRTEAPPPPPAAAAQLTASQRASIIANLRNTESNIQSDTRMPADAKAHAIDGIEKKIAAVSSGQ